ncbi:uncharacterized protein [Littorina saxatilis]|uniref:TIR domain-containing protein n=1 Tax=Littorina saxatilis TaxID=31220 RepID=A0AAN9B1N9_9CAEN
MELFQQIGKSCLCAVRMFSECGVLALNLPSTLLSKTIKTKLSPNAKFCVTVLLIVWYGYLLCTSSEWSGDHVDIGCIHVLTFLPTIRFLSSMYGKLLLAKALQLLSAYGWKRLLMHSLFLFSFSYVFVVVFLDWSALTAGRTLTDFFISRFENNVLHVNEDRTLPDQMTHRSLNDRDTYFFHKLLRYPMEDVQMNCTVNVLGLPGGKPYKNQVEWRLNGVPLSHMTDRHSHVVDFKELPKDHPALNLTLRTMRPKEIPENHPILDQTLKVLGHAVFSLKSTLSIHLVEHAEFGSYTCHFIDGVKYTMNPQENTTTERKHEKQRKSRPKKTAKRKTNSIKQCTCQPEPMRFFQDLHELRAEYRLIMMREKQEQISAPPSSILFFKTSYWHLTSNEDVQMDYTVNDVSYPDLCKGGTFHGCSALQRLLSEFINNGVRGWWYMSFLPFRFWERSAIYGHQFTTGHCLCENSFGRHNIRYMRTYYNKTSERNELIEITHPHTLLVRPPSQNASSFLSNFFHFSPIQFLPLTEYLPEQAYDLSLLKDLAVVCTMVLNITDGVIIILGIGMFLCFMWVTFHILRMVGVASKNLCLRGSMAYLYTATKTTRLLLQQIKTETEVNTANKFNFYICHSDSEVDRAVLVKLILHKLEKDLGMTCCVRDRDLPPNQLELNALEEGIQRSERFIILLSKDLLGDACRETEMSMIMESVWEHHSKEMNVLVIRLDNCEVPTHLADFVIHDWTSTNLNLNDRLLRLVRWVAPQDINQRSALDAWMTVFPLLIVGTVLLAWLLFWG